MTPRAVSRRWAEHFAQGADWDYTTEEIQELALALDAAETQGWNAAVEAATKAAIRTDLTQCCHRLKDGSHVPSCAGEICEESAEEIRTLTRPTLEAPHE